MAKENMPEKPAKSAFHDTCMIHQQHAYGCDVPNIILEKPA
jgi:hypothetical protein